MRVIRGNLFDTGLTVLAHQVNCQSTMGSGVAAQVKRLYPGAYRAYLQKINDLSPRGALGKASVYFGSKKIIMNVYGQFDYRRAGSVGLTMLDELFTQFTDYAAFKSGMIDGIETIRDFIADNCLEATETFSIAIPYKIGCAHGGADWGEIEAILTEIEDECNVEFVAYKLEAEI